MNEIREFSKTLLDRMLSESNLDNGYDINNGSCDFFAEKIISRFPDKKLEIITTDDLVNYIDGNKDVPQHMSKKIESFFNQMESKIFPKESFVDTNTVLYEMGYHEWVFDIENDVHYDAESTSGTSDITEIPFIRDHIFMALATSGYFLDKRADLLKSIRKLTERVMDNVLENSNSFNQKNKLINTTMKDLEKIYSGITADIKNKKEKPSQEFSL